MVERASGLRDWRIQQRQQTAWEASLADYPALAEQLKELLPALEFLGDLRELT
jgi:hypothetical protein